jgi:hypothetical protein
MSGNSALAAYTRAAQGRNTDYTGNPAAQLAGWQHSVDTALGNAGETSPQGTLQYLFGNSVTSAMSSAITQKNEHTLLTAQTQGQVMQVLPEISTGLTLTVERILNELQAVINFNRMGFGFKQITIEQLETRLTQWHNGADLTGGTVASYTGRSYTFAVNRYAAAAQIEATALLGPRAPMIFEAILAGLVQSLRLCYAKLALTCMLNNGGKPSYSQSGADGNSGRLLGDVLSFYNRVACFGSRSTNALTMLSTMLTKEAEKRGDQDWPYLLVSQSFVRRAAALLTPGPNLITGKPGGAAVRESSAVAAVSAALGKTLIVIPTIPDGRRFIQLLIRRVHCTEHTLVPASYHVDQRVRQIVLEGKDEATKQAKKRGLELALKRSVVITQVDRVTGIRHSFTVDHLMSNATAGASAAIQAAVNKAGGSVADKNILILDNDIVTLAPHSIVGDAMIACGPKAVDLYATQVLADALRPNSVEVHHRSEQGVVFGRFVEHGDFPTVQIFHRLDRRSGGNHDDQRNFPQDDERTGAARPRVIAPRDGNVGLAGLQDIGAFLEVGVLHQHQAHARVLLGHHALVGGHEFLAIAAGRTGGDTNRVAS